MLSVNADHPVLGADDTVRYRAAQTAQRVTDGNHGLAHHKVCRGAQCGGNEPLCLYADNSEVGLGVGGHQSGIQGGAVMQAHRNAVCTADNVVVCDDIAVGRDDHTAACACGNILVEIAAGLHGFRCDLNHGIAGRRGNTGRIQARAPGHGRVSGRRLIHHDVLRFGHGTAVGVYSAEIGRCAAQSHQHKPVQKRVALSLPCGDHVDHGPAAARRSERLVRTPVSLRMIPLSVRPLRAVRINAHTSSLLLWMERAPPCRR